RTVQFAGQVTSGPTLAQSVSISNTVIVGSAEIAVNLGIATRTVCLIIEHPDKAHRIRGVAASSDVTPWDTTSRIDSSPVPDVLVRLKMTEVRCMGPCPLSRPRHDDSSGTAPQVVRVPRHYTRQSGSAEQ